MIKDVEWWKDRATKLEKTAYMARDVLFNWQNQEEIEDALEGIRKKEK